MRAIVKTPTQLERWPLLLQACRDSHLKDTQMATLFWQEGASVSSFLIIQQHISLRNFSYNTGNEALVVLVGVYARKSLPEIYFLVQSTPPGFCRSLTEVLKDKLGFKGFVISDWEALDRLSKPLGSNYRLCVSTAVNAGTDMVMVGQKHREFVKDLIFLAESGEIPMTRIDDAVERILRVKFVAGLFEHPFADRSLLDIVGSKVTFRISNTVIESPLVQLSWMPLRKQ
ncbi:hypothetical protein OIU77_028329 [Salix suchowensis]|uniref:Glycoside hydrolase family 3 N-terminal domain-containing protein n=1 Tax=Salix suchowensis TaxID=1278906 RepID=A0ABQ9BJ95_9ROSI|nr:hypothetical protein OIU77_028329 [Salix suchowensis]